MPNSLVIIGAPSSAGAYAPGQEKAPAALRAAGLPERLRSRGIEVEDRGDVPGFRWRADRQHPRAMNADVVEAVARAVSGRVGAALSEGAAVLVLGGDCTVELGTVTGSLAQSPNVGLVYVDFDTDLNTPESTDEGALDWMGVAHLLGIEGAVAALVALCPRVPMLRPDQVLYFGPDNIRPFERRIIEERGIARVPLAEVAADPSGAARAVVEGWAKRFERLLIHVDIDVLDFFDAPLAENTRRNSGLRLDQLMEALGTLLQAPNWAALTVAEVNPDHGEADGSTMRLLVEKLAAALAGSPRLRRG